MMTNVPAIVWSGNLVFGLVSIPVRLYKAARRERIRFHNVARTPRAETPEPPFLTDRIRQMPSRAPEPQSEPEVEPTEAGPADVVRVRNAFVRDDNQRSLTQPEILKGFEVEKDRYVVLEPEEVKAIRPRTSTELDILEFVRLSEIDPTFFETSYYVAPARNGEKPYALLYRALMQTGYAALGTFAMHGREHSAIIRAGRRGLILHTIFYSAEVREAEEYDADPNLVNSKELALAEQFVKALAAKFDPAKLKDTVKERLQALIEERLSETGAESTRRKQDRAEPVPDIMEALRKSLEMARKPVQRESGPKKERGASPQRRRAR